MLQSSLRHVRSCTVAASSAVMAPRKRPLSSQEKLGTDLQGLLHRTHNNAFSTTGDPRPAPPRRVEGLRGTKRHAILADLGSLWVQQLKAQDFERGSHSNRALGPCIQVQRPRHSPRAPGAAAALPLPQPRSVPG